MEENSPVAIKNEETRCWIVLDLELSSGYRNQQVRSDKGWPTSLKVGSCLADRLLLVLEILVSLNIIPVHGTFNPTPSGLIVASSLFLLQNLEYQKQHSSVVNCRAV